MSEADTPHRRGTDRELVGWIRASGDDFVAIDLLGRQVTAPTDWVTAEEALDELGIGYLANRFEYFDGNEWVPVRISETSSNGIGLLVDHGAVGVIGAPQQRLTAAFPLDPQQLRQA